MGRVCAPNPICIQGIKIVKMLAQKRLI